MLPLVLVLATAALDVPVTSPSSVHEERLARLLTALERDANFEPSFAAPTLGLGLGLTVFGSVLTAALGGGTLALFWAALGCAPFALIWLVGEIVGFAVTASDRASARQRTAQLSDEASEVAALLPDGVERLAAWRDSRPERRGPSLAPAVVLLVVGVLAMAAGPVAFFALGGVGGPAIAGLVTMLGVGMTNTLLAIPLLADAVDRRPTGGVRLAAF